MLGVYGLSGPSLGRAEPGSDPAAHSAPSAGGRAGSWVQVDPQTGKRVPQSARGAAAIPPDPRFSTSHQGLVEQPAPGGGMMIDLQGRFRSAATATVGADGTVHRDCVPPGAAAGQEGMTFFVTSVGKGNGADLGGLEGADAHCLALAKAAGSLHTNLASVRKHRMVRPGDLPGATWFPINESAVLSASP